MLDRLAAAGHDPFDPALAPADPGQSGASPAPRYAAATERQEAGQRP